MLSENGGPVKHSSVLEVNIKELSWKEKNGASMIEKN